MAACCAESSPNELSSFVSAWAVPRMQGESGTGDASTDISKVAAILRTCPCPNALSETCLVSIVVDSLVCCCSHQVTKMLGSLQMPQQ